MTQHVRPQVLLGIDLGGTKVEGVVIDAARPDIPLKRVRLPTEQEKGYDHILDRIVELVEILGAPSADAPSADATAGNATSADATTCAIGIATPGTWDLTTHTLRGSNTQCLNGRPLRSDLAARLNRAVSIENDANCFAMAEATLGAARGFDTVFGIIMGTGCGGAFIANGQLLRGRHGIAGEWGQLVVEPNGETSPHGTRGTLEAYITGPALEAFYHREAGTARSLAEIASRTTQDPAARLTIDRLVHYFVKGLTAVIDTFDPHAIVVGGGVGNCDILYCDEVRSRLSASIFAPAFEAALLRPTMGDSAGVFGAALLTKQ